MNVTHELLETVSLPTPYYDEGGIVPAIQGLLDDCDFILSDPPYGINYRSNHNSSRRGKFAKWVRSENFPGIYGDDQPPDLSFLCELNKVMAFFGGNYFTNQLSPSRCWIIWDKRDGIGPNNQADCEMVWTNFQKASRLYRHLWSGMLRAGQENISCAQKQHPHQKPLELMKFIVQYSDTVGAILDPFMGSGTTLVAAKNLGRKAIGIEVAEKYCEIAADRLRQECLRF